MDTTHASILNKNPLSICTLNVNSIRSSAKQALVNDYLQRTNPHIIVMTETKIDDTFNPKFPNYETLARKDRSAGAGGILCIARTGIKTHSVESTDIGPTVQLCRFIIKTTQFIVVYKSPSTKALEERKLMTKLKKYLATGLDTLLTGDFNLPRIPTGWPATSITDTSLPKLDRDWLETIKTCELTQRVHQPTYKGSTAERASATSRGSTLDLVFTTPRLQVHECGVYEYDIDPTFDHHPVVTRIQTSPVIKPKKVKAYKETDCTWLLFRQQLYVAPINRILTEHPTTKAELDEAVDDLLTTLTTAYRDTTPSYMIDTKARHPWMTRQLKKEMNSVRTLNRNAKNEKKPSKRRSMYERLRLRKVRLRKLIDLQQREFQKKIVKKCTLDSKRFFGLINGFKPPQAPVGPLTVQGRVTEDDGEMATAFNDYLASHFGRGQDLLSGWENYRDTWKLPMAGTFIQKIKQLKNHSAPGEDGVTTKMLKYAMGTVAPLLAVITKCVVDLSYFPDALKETKVKMLHKKNSRQDIKNYRPIALTSILGKLIESVITDELVRHLETNEILDANQHGFRTKNGCHTALLSMWNGVSTYVDSHGGCSLIGLDLTKAFDKVNHQVLLDELAKCNVEYKLGEVVKSWLEGRTQFVQVGEEKSQPTPVTASVVQGSRLGPVLWLVYINGLLRELQSKKQRFTAFADDIVLYGPVNSAAGAQKIQTSLDIIQRWSTDHHMRFSDSKSNYMTIGTQTPFAPEINEAKIPRVNEMTILGVIFSKDGKFTRMARGTTQNVTYKIHVLRNNLKHRDEKSMKLIYHAFVKSRLFYCSQVWHQRNAAANTMIRRTLKQFWDLNGGRPRDVLTTKEQLFYNDVMQIKKIQTGSTVIRNYDIGISGNDDRNPSSIQAVRATRFQLRNDLRNRAGTLWNWLPTELRACTDTPANRGRLLAHVLSARASADTRGRLPDLT